MSPPQLFVRKGSTSKKVAMRLSFASTFVFAHDVRRLSATLTDILTSVGGSSPNTFSRVFATDCLQSTNKKKPPFQVTFFVCGRLHSILLELLQTMIY